MGEIARRSTRDFFIYGLGQAVGQVANFLLVPLYVRVLTPEEYGAVALLAAVQLMALPISLWGTDAALFRSFFDDEDRVRRGRVATSSLVIVAVTATVLVFAGWALSPRIGNAWLGDVPEAGAVVALVFASIALKAPGQIGMSLLRAERRAAAYSALSIAGLIVRLGAIVYGVAVADLGVLGFALGAVVGDFAASVLALVTARRSFCALPAAEEVRRQVAFGTPVMAANIAALILVGFDRFLIERSLGLGQVAVYALGYQIGNLMMIVVVNPVQLVWPTVALRLRDRDDAPQLYGDALLAVLAGGLGIAGLLAAWAPLIVTVLAPDPAYAPAALVVPFVAVANLMVIVQRIMSIGLEIDRTMTRYALWFWIAAAADMALCLLLIPSMGITGAAVATVVAYLMLPAMAFWLSRGARVTVRYPRRGLFAVSVLLAGVLGLAIGLAASGTPAWTVGGVTTTALAVSAGVLWAVARRDLMPVFALVRTAR